jgi:hypothetical protein
MGSGEVFSGMEIKLYPETRLKVTLYGGGGGTVMETRTFGLPPLEVTEIELE